jgi:hypothetical protein
MQRNSLSYYAHRARVEQRQADKALSSNVRHAHAELSHNYCLMAMKCVLDEVRAHTPAKD